MPREFPRAHPRRSEHLASAWGRVEAAGPRRLGVTARHESGVARLKRLRWVCGAGSLAPLPQIVEHVFRALVRIKCSHGSVTRNPPRWHGPCTQTIADGRTVAAGRWRTWVSTSKTWSGLPISGWRAFCCLASLDCSSGPMAGSRPAARCDRLPWRSRTAARVAPAGRSARGTAWRRCGYWSSPAPTHRSRCGHADRRARPTARSRPEPGRSTAQSSSEPRPVGRVAGASPRLAGSSSTAR